MRKLLIAAALLWIAGAPAFADSTLSAQASLTGLSFSVTDLRPADANPATYRIRRPESSSYAEAYPPLLGVGETKPGFGGTSASRMAPPLEVQTWSTADSLYASVVAPNGGLDSNVYINTGSGFFAWIDVAPHTSITLSAEAFVSLLGDTDLTSARVYDYLALIDVEPPTAVWYRDELLLRGTNGDLSDLLSVTFENNSGSWHHLAMRADASVIANVPEPANGGLFVAGLGVLGALVWRRRAHPGREA